MPAHLLYGDSFLVTQALKGLQGEVGPPEVLEANSHRLSATQLDQGQLRALCDAVPFLAEHRLVVVEGLFSLFHTGRRTRSVNNPPSAEPAPRSQVVNESRPGGRRAATPARRGHSTGPRNPSPAAWEDLPRYIGEEMPPTTLLVFMEERLSKGNPLLRKLTAVVQVRECATPRGEGLARWVRNRIAEKGARITPGAMSLLCQLVGGNLWTMDNELEKLAVYAGDRAIEEGDVRLLVSQSREASIFSAVDALLEGRTAVALPLMHRLRDDGAELPYIVAMIARQLRLVTLARDLVDRGSRERDIGDRLGLTQDFILRRTLAQARKHSQASLRWLYGRLMEADLAVKQGRMEQDVALELLVSEASVNSTGPRTRTSAGAGYGPR